MTEYGETFNDVMFVPQYSEETTRSGIGTTTNMGKFTLGLPLISSNMDDITGPKMACEIARHGGLGILHRFGNMAEAVSDFQTARGMIENCKKFVEGKDHISIPKWMTPMYSVGVSVGVKEQDKARFLSLASSGARLFCLDVAHGHHILVKKMIKYIRDNDRDGDICIIAGNVATPNGAIDLFHWGADIVKIGIGPGCFISGTLVQTKNGKKPIEEIKDGEEVLTHRGRYKKVVAAMTRKENENLIKINGIKCTRNHEFYVLNKKYSEIVTDDNMNEYAEWIRADELTKDYLLLKIK